MKEKERRTGSRYNVQMILRDVAPSGKSHSRKAVRCGISFHPCDSFRMGKSIETESHLAVVRGWAWEWRKGQLLMYRISLWSNRYILELDYGDGCKAL